MYIMKVTPELLSGFVEIIAYHHGTKYDYHFKLDRDLGWTRISYPIEFDFETIKMKFVNEKLVCKRLTRFIKWNHFRNKKFTVVFTRADGSYAEIHEIAGIRSEQSGFDDDIVAIVDPNAGE